MEQLTLILINNNYVNVNNYNILKITMTVEEYGEINRHS